MAHDIFISYSSKNEEFANVVCERLEDNGIECWIAPRNIKTGTNYAKEIMDGLNAAKVVVLVFSKEAQGSEYVNNEIDTAFSTNKPIVSLKVDDTFPKDQMEFFLKNTQWLDASPSALKKENKTLDDCYDQLVVDVKRVLDGAPLNNDISGQGGQGKVIPHKQKGFFEKYKLPIVAVVVVLIAVAGFMVFNGTDSQQSDTDEATVTNNETGIEIGYVGLEDFGDDTYGYYVYGSIPSGLSSSSKDVVHIDFYNKDGKVVYSNDTKIGDVKGNTLGSIEVDKKNVDKVTVELQDKKGNVLYSVESSDVLEQ